MPLMIVILPLSNVIVTQERQSSVSALCGPWHVPLLIIREQKTLPPATAFDVCVTLPVSSFPTLVPRVPSPTAQETRRHALMAKPDPQP